MLGRTGAAYGQQQAQEQQTNLKNQGDLTKLRQAEVRALEGKDQQASLVKALYGGNKGMNPTIKVVDGKLISARMNPATGQMETEVLSGSQDQVKAKLYKTFYDAAIKNEHPNPEQYASEQMEATLKGFGGTTVTGKANSIPGVRSAGVAETPAPQPLEGIGEPIGSAGTVDVEGSVVSDLSPEDRALATRLIQRINTNPKAAANDTRRLEEILMKYQTPGQPSVKAPAAPAMTYIDKPKREMEQETGKVSGKALGEEHQGLNIAAESSAQLNSQLDLLKKIYQNPNMPEGELAGQLQSIRSGLKTIGIDVGAEVGAADLAKSISGKMALLTRTADGKNLMPGAMSDFEQKILRGLVPGLESTVEGRTALIDVMQAMSKARMRFAQEANTMADANRGILPSEWNARKMRIMKEEMAKMAHLNAEIAARFKGGK
jgi:hypothetical protein